jgi:phospholipid/cholesterol/gamma-HCH transport system substrate-binding protein
MEAEARYTLVGATIIALVLAGIAAIFWLKGAGAREEARLYTIYFQRQSLDGLQVGADVTMLGVSVGKVVDYAIDPRALNRVQVTVRVAERTPVGQTTTAVVQRNVLTGIARISLVTPGEPGPPLAAVQPGEAYPIIPEGTSDLQQIADAANRIAHSGAIALDNVNGVLSAENQKAFGQTLANVQQITAALASRMDRMDEVIGAVGQSAADVGRASRDFAETARQMQAAVGSTALQAETALKDVSRAVGTLERESEAAVRRAYTAIEIGSLEISATAADLRATADVVARTFDRLRDARTALFGPSESQLGPGERLK